MAWKIMHLNQLIAFALLESLAIQFFSQGVYVNLGNDSPCK